MKNRILLILCFCIIISCDNDGRGYEYMPNMYRSPSLETYSINNFFKDSLSAREPVKGTIARGYLSSFNYDASLEDYLLAGENAVNPIKSNGDNMLEGKKLYSMFCKHCHGDNGMGGGSITHPIYSNPPHYNDNKNIRNRGLTMFELKEGHIFHTITHGYNTMGPHFSQLTEEERWQIVLYVQELQKISIE